MNNLELIKKSKKILVIGCPGSGKSYFSEKISEAINIPTIHLDTIYWKPNWVKMENEEFDKLIINQMEKESWILDGNYNRTLKLRMSYCDLIIFLDMSTEVCLNSYLERLNIPFSLRDDLTKGCHETYDEDFVNYIKNFNNDSKDSNRNKIIDILSNSKKSSIILSSRDEVNQLLDNIKG